MRPPLNLLTDKKVCLADIKNYLNLSFNDIKSIFDTSEVSIDIYEQAIDDIYEIISKSSSDVEIYNLLLLIQQLLKDKVILSIDESKFIKYLLSENPLICQESARIVTFLILCQEDEKKSMHVTTIVDWIFSVLDLSNTDTNTIVPIMILQNIIIKHEYRDIFISNNTYWARLLKLLTFTRSYQIKYSIILCIWILSFEQQIYTDFDATLLEFIPLSTELVKDISKEKIIRLIVAIWRNFLLFSFEKSVPMFVGTRALESVTILMDRKLIDEELHTDLESIFEILNRVYQSLKYFILYFSSFDEYVSQVKSGRVEWSLLHKSNLFWNENAIKLEENDFEIFKDLVDLLKGSNNPEVLAIVANDFAAYMENRPNGWKKIEEFSVKRQLMLLMSHEDRDVRYQALNAVQKYMSSVLK